MRSLDLDLAFVLRGVIGTVIGEDVEPYVDIGRGRALSFEGGEGDGVCVHDAPFDFPIVSTLSSLETPSARSGVSAANARAMAVSQSSPGPCSAPFAPEMGRPRATVYLFRGVGLGETDWNLPELEAGSPLLSGEMSRVGIGDMVRGSPLREPSLDKVGDAGEVGRGLA
jgi:hypothetical protein